MEVQRIRSASSPGQVLLNETRTEVDINLDEWPVANAAESMDLAGLDDQNVARAGLEFLPVDGPETPAFPDELHLIVRMTMRPGAPARQCAEEEDGDVDVAVLCSNEFVRAAPKRQVLLPDAIHPDCAPVAVGYEVT
jgi:hypothetical protein